MLFFLNPFKCHVIVLGRNENIFNNTSPGPDDAALNICNEVKFFGIINSHLCKANDCSLKRNALNRIARSLKQNEKLPTLLNSFLKVQFEYKGLFFIGQ